MLEQLEKNILVEVLKHLIENSDFVKYNFSFLYEKVKSLLMLRVTIYF